MSLNWFTTNLISLQTTRVGYKVFCKLKVICILQKVLIYCLRTLADFKTFENDDVI